MSSFITFLAKSLTVLVLASVVAAEKTTINYIPGAYIVEFEASDINSKSISKSSFYSNLSSSRITAEPRLDLHYELFKGASFRLDSKDDKKDVVDLIQSFQSVKKIWPVRLYSRPAKLLGAFAGTDESAQASNIKRSLTDTFTPHVMGGVDKLHEEGFTGEGIFIGVVDTGVDYLHPALGGCFGPGCKVVTGTDLVGDAYTGVETPVPDDDPIDCEGHGTHVSGTIAAGPNSFNFTGVAPNATLGIWKVFGCTGDVGTDILIQAFNLAYEAGVDIISSSIGGPSGWTEEPWDVVVQRISEKGVPCVLSAGNDGASGVFDTSSASESIGSTSVGSIDNTLALVFLTGASYTTNKASPTDFGYARGTTNGEFGNVTATLYAASLDTTLANDGCSPFSDNTPDLANSVVLIRRGTCTFDVKIQNAVAKGAKRVLFYNNSPNGAIAPGASSPTVPVGMISATQAQIFVDALAAGVKIEITFGGTAPVFSSGPNNATPGKMSIFSSWGPSFELWIKPEVSAPGGMILSTYPRAKGNFAVLSGTSMAAPYIAGTIALLMQIRGKKAMTPQEITALLAVTAAHVQFNTGTTTSNFLAPVIQQGGGLVNAFEAAKTTTLLDLDTIALNDSAVFVPEHPIKISNIGTASQTYTFANLIAATAFTLTDGNIVPDLFPPNLVADAASCATITFDVESLTVEPGSTGVVVARFAPPQGLDATRIPIYSGYVSINGTNGDTLTLPYGGITSRIKDAKLINTRAGFPIISTSNETETASNRTVFTIPGKVNITGAIYPAVAFELAMGSRIVRLDIVPEKAGNLTTVLGQQILGPVPGTPLENQPRNVINPTIWHGKLVDGSFAPAGRYKILMRALMISGDEDVAADYELAETPFFEINYSGAT